VNVVAPGQRRVEPDDAGGLSLIQPCGQRIAGANAQPAEIDDVKPGSATGSQARDAGDDVDVVIERRADNGADLEVVAALRLLPIMEAVHQMLEPRKRQRAALPRFRDQAVAADVRARRMAQREPDSLADNTPRHSESS
jgi:hypothetical protein